MDNSIVTETRQKVNRNLSETAEKLQEGVTSNTPTSDYKFGEEEFRTVASGIDTLVVGFTGDLQEGFAEVIDEMKNREENEDGINYQIGDYVFSVQPHGARRYRYIIQNDLMSISINQRAKNDSYPNVMVTFYSPFLWQNGFVTCWSKVLKVLGRILVSVDDEKISRVDICTDIQGERLHEILSDLNSAGCWVTPAQTRGTMFDSRGNVQTWTIGKRGRNHYVRVYNKTLQVEKTGKDFIKEVWEENNYNPDLPVWRIEVEIRRDTLNKYNINSIQDLYNHVGELWKHFTEKYLQFKPEAKFSNRNRTREESAGWWQVLQAKAKNMGKGINKGYELKKRIARGTYEGLKAGFKGFFTSMGMSMGIFPEGADKKSLEQFLCRIFNEIIEEMGTELLNEDGYRKAFERKITRYQSILA